MLPAKAHNPQATPSLFILPCAQAFNFILSSLDLPAVAPAEAAHAIIKSYSLCHEGGAVLGKDAES